MRASRAVAVACVAVLANGCITMPDDQPREQALAQDALGLSGPAYRAPADHWWQALGDQQLDRLVEQALAGNPGLRISLARMQGAWAQSQALDSSDEPQVDFDAYAARERVSAVYIYPPPYGGSTFWEARVGLNLAWNLDFWGRQASLIEQSRSVARAAEIDVAGARLALSGAVAQTYVDLGRAHALEQLALRARDQRETLLGLTGRRVRAGLDSEVEMRTAESNRAQVDVELEQARVANEVATHALAALTGQGAAAYAGIAGPTLDLEAALPLPVALPVDLLAHRPDVAAAQARVAAAQAGRTAAHAAFYPNVDLLAFGGFAAIGLEEISRGDALTWSVGPALHLPLLDAGRLRAEYRKSTADLDAAVASYNETVVRAVREAADQGARVHSLDRQLEDQQRALVAAEQAYRLAEQRYSAGISNFLTVLNAESQVLGARRQRINLLADRALARIALLVALGGSFDSTGSTPLAATLDRKETTP